MLNFKNISIIQKIIRKLKSDNKVSELDSYIISKNPATINDAEYWVAQFHKHQTGRKGFWSNYP